MKFLIQFTTWMNLEHSMLSERSQALKATYCVILLTRKSRIDKSTETESSLVFPRGWEQGGREVTASGDEVLLG